MRKIDIGLLIAIFVVAGATVVAIATSQNETDGGSATSSPSGPTIEATDYVDCPRGPDAGRCGELAWALQVAERAGFEIEPPEPEGGAPEITKGIVHLHLSAGVAEDEGSRRDILRQEGYERVRSVAGTPVFFDGTRVTWEVEPLIVWVDGAGIQDADPSSTEIADLVRASTAVPYP